MLPLILGGSIVAFAVLKSNKVPGNVQGRAPLSVATTKPQTTGNPASAQSVPNNKGNKASQPWTSTVVPALGAAATKASVDAVVAGFKDLFYSDPSNDEGPDIDEDAVDELATAGDDQSSNDDYDDYDFDSSFGSDGVEDIDTQPTEIEEEGDYYE